MTQRPCDVCGTVYEAKRPSSRFCTPRCRQRKARGRMPATPPVVVVDPTAEADGGLVEATRRRLTQAGVIDSMEAQSAILLAGRIERGTSESGSAIATLNRELRSTMESALKESVPTGNLIDELRAKRETRAARA